jgi:hypothetical protein
MQPDATLQHEVSGRESVVKYIIKIRFLYPSYSVCARMFLKSENDDMNTITPYDLYRYRYNAE